MYKYDDMKAKLFSDEGQRKFLQVRDKINSIIPASGCIRLGEVMTNIGGDSWIIMACVDRMVELGELVEIKYENSIAQKRIFVKPN